LLVWLLPLLGWHDSYSISRSPGRHPDLNPVLRSNLKEFPLQNVKSLILPAMDMRRRTTAGRHNRLHEGVSSARVIPAAFHRVTVADNPDRPTLTRNHDSVVHRCRASQPQTEIGWMSASQTSSVVGRRPRRLCTNAEPLPSVSLLWYSFIGSYVASPGNPPDLHDTDGRFQRPQSLRLLPCFPAQNGQKGQSSPSGKSSPSSWGQPMFPSLAATDLTPCSSKNSWISILTFGLVVTSVATHRSMIGSAFGDLITPAAILVVLLSSGP